VRSYLVTYMLPGAAENLLAIQERLQAFPAWAQLHPNAYVVAAHHTWGGAAKIRNYVQEALPEGATIFVLRSARESAWNNVECSDEWLQEWL